MKRKILAACVFSILLPNTLFALSSSDPICSVQESLARGSRGAAVTILQNFLREQDTFHAESTGYFGSLTEAALANWQLEAGIITRIQDGGVFGPRTRQYLRNQGCPALIPASATKESTKTAPVQTKTLPAQKAATQTAAKKQEEQCIPPPALPAISCSGYWEKTFNTKGCHVGWTCISAVISTTATTTQKQPVNNPPFISSITGPTRLKTGEAGTWVVTASDPEYEAIEFSVIWGDEGGSIAQLLELARLGIYTFSTQTTYTHTYQKSGSFTIVVFARDIMNNDTRATLSVVVESPPPPPYSQSAYYSQANYNSYTQATYYSQGSYGNTGPTGGTSSCVQSSQFWEGIGSTYPHEAVVCSVNVSCWLAARCCNGRWYSGGNIIGAGQSCAYWAQTGAQGSL